VKVWYNREDKKNMPNYNFKKDLSVAKETEKEVAKLLQERYGLNILSFEETNRYDILTEKNEKQLTFEIKEDFLCEKTGNVGLEFECRGKPSGIQTSQADYHIYKLHTADCGIQYVLHKTSVLKDMIETHMYFRIVNGGDKGSNSMNYLFKYNVFVSTGKIIFAS